jgi:4-coumarate--CoA ligase
VAPAELEDILQSHEDVLEAAVTATYDNNQRTEVPIGYTVLRPDIKDADRARVLENVLAFVHERVSSYKKLRGGLHYINAIPKNANGKVVRNQLPVRVEAANAAAAKLPAAKL